MTKKLFLGMFVAAGMLLATSCSNDELDVVQSGNEAQVTSRLVWKVVSKPVPSAMVQVPRSWCMPFTSLMLRESLNCRKW